MTSRMNSSVITEMDISKLSKKTNKIFLEISKKELSFNLNELNFVDLATIKNISNRRIAFKIKSTNTKNFVVKPNRGDLQKNEQIMIEFKLINIDRKNIKDDKFMIIACGISESYDEKQIDIMWKSFNNNENDFDYQCTKINAKYFALGFTGEKIYIQEEKPNLRPSHVGIIEKKDNILSPSLKEFDYEEKYKKLLEKYNKLVLEMSRKEDSKEKTVINLKLWQIILLIMIILTLSLYLLDFL